MVHKVGWIERISIIAEVLPVVVLGKDFIGSYTSIVFP